MQLHEIKPQHVRRRALRVGRGGKRGTTSGRGQKGQKARSGHRLPRAERELIMKFPKARGVKNKPVSERAVIVRAGDIGALATDGRLTREILAKNGIIAGKRARVKILGSGAVKIAVEVIGVPASASAKKAIEAAGGRIVADDARAKTRKPDANTAKTNS